MVGVLYGEVDQKVAFVSAFAPDRHAFVGDFPHCLWGNDVVAGEVNDVVVEMRDLFCEPRQCLSNSLENQRECTLQQ